VLIQGIIGQSQVKTATVSTASDTEILDLALFYSGSKLDLHVYDEMSRHVGRDYQTGAIETQIPSATISGLNDTMQRVSIMHASGHVYRVQVIGVEATDSPNFVLFSSEAPKALASMLLIPTNITSVARNGDNITVVIMEVGYVTPLQNITLSLQGNISQVLEMSTSLIGEIAPGHMYVISLRVNGRPGSYTGSIAVSPWNAGADTTEISIIVTSLTGDINRDGVVDYRDLAVLVSAYGSFEGQQGYNPMADFNADGKIDYRDLAILVSNYGRTY